MSTDLGMLDTTPLPARTIGMPQAAEGVSLADPDSVRGLLTGPGTRSIPVPYTAGLLTHPRTRGLAGLDTTFHFRWRGSLRSLPARLRQALRAAGISSAKTAEAVAAEVAFLASSFARLVDDAQPLLRLAVVGDGGAPPGAAEEPGHLPRRALVYTLAHAVEKPAPLPLRHAAEVFAAARARDWPVGELQADHALLLTFDSSGANAGAVGVPAVPPPAPRLVLCMSSEYVEPATLIRSPARDAVAGPAEVVLASMPFGPLLQPSLGLSLLAAGLDGRYSARIRYFTMPFARLIGVPLYEWITDGHPNASALLGEWLFRDALFTRQAADSETYLEEILLAPTRRWQADQKDRPSFITLVPDGLVATLSGMRPTIDRFVDDCVGEILAHDPRVVGLTSVFQQQTASLALARRLKALAPEVAVVLGGPNTEGVMGVELVRQIPWIDAVVNGEGEVVFPQLVERLITGRSFDDLVGVFHSRSPEARLRSACPPPAASPRHLDDLPYPKFDDFFDQWRAAEFDHSYQPRLLFETSRGCWWGEKQHCTFCGLNGNNMSFRSKSADRAFAELSALVREHPGLFVATADNILDMRYFRTLLPRLAREKIRLKLFYEVKANLKKEQVRLLRAAGVIEIQPGIESLSDRVLAIMGKGVTALQNVQLLKWCQEFGVWPLYNFIWGFPTEPPEAYAQMAGIVPLLHHLPPPSGMSRIYLERFSPNHAQAAERGFIDVRATPAYGHVYPFAPEVLDRLAYHFAYNYREPRDVAAYTRPLAEAVVVWREAHTKSRLLYVDRGDRLLICDTRKCARQNIHVLTGLQRTLYLASDAVVSVGRLVRSAVAAGYGESSPAAVEEALAPLVEAGLMVRRGPRLLALALQAPDASKRSQEGTTHP